MWLTRLSITRPVTILMLVAALLVIGLKSRSQLPVDLYPDIEFPAVVIVTTYPGTGPEEIETLITKPIEDSASSVNGIDKLSSTSSEGLSMVVIRFELGTDLDTAVSDVRAKLDVTRGILPDDADDPIVIKADTSAMPVLSLSLSSNLRTPLELRDLAEDVIKDRLSQVPGVASVAVSGGDVREIRVEVDQDRLEAHRISITQVVAALKAENLNVPSGNIEEARRTTAVRVLGEFQSPQEILDVRIPTATNPDLRVRDIAEVRDTVAEQTAYTRVNGVPSVAIRVVKQSDGNTVEVVEGVREELDRLTGGALSGKRQAGAKAAGPGGHKGLGGASLIPDDVQITIASDESTFIKETIRDVNRSLLEGAFLAVVIVFLFLHMLRGTFIVSLAIPTSIIATFTVMHILGFSMNMMSMMGLALSVGILVDDSIVVLENIHRHLKMGASPKDAAYRGRSEIGLAAITITTVDVVVFFPIAFMGGMIGQFFRQFGVVVATATLFSLFVSFTLTPMLASRWLKPVDEEETGGQGLGARFSAAWDFFYGKVDRFYRGLLAWSLEHGSIAIAIGLMTMVGSIAIAMPKPTWPRLFAGLPAMTGGVVAMTLLWLAIARTRGGLGFLAKVAGLVLSGMLIRFVTKVADMGTPMAGALMVIFLLVIMPGTAWLRRKDGQRAIRPLLVWAAVMGLASLLVPGNFRFEFAPTVDRRQFEVTVDYEVGTSLEVTDATARRIEAALLDRNLYPEVKSLFTTAGASRTGGGLGAFGGDTDYATISGELEDYVPGKTRRTDEIVRDINARFADLPGVTVRASSSGGITHGKPVQIEVTGTDQGQIVTAAYQVAQALKETPGTFAVELSSREGRPELQARIDRERAAQYGVSVAQVATALRASLQGDTTTKYREEGDEYDIRVTLPEAQRDRTDRIPNLVVATTATGRPVYLYEVATLDTAGGPTKLERSERQRTVTVSCELAEGVALGNAQLAINERLAKLQTNGVSVRWVGQAEFMEESNRNMMSALGLSVLLVFMLMAALFESLLSPLIIMLSVPQAMAGAFFALTFTGKSLSMPSMIGMIMLVGLVTKNAILLVDYTNTLRREHGMERRAALLQAGPTRLQPILMTTLAMIGGMLPTAMALTKGSEMRQPMAIAVIGGLVLSTFLTLLMVPVFYEVMDELGERFARAKEAVIRLLGV